MTDTNDTTPPPAATTLPGEGNPTIGVTVVPGAGPVGDTPPARPQVNPTPPADTGRPGESLKAQFDELYARVEELHREKDTAVQTKKNAAAAADDADQNITTLQTEIRTMKLTAAAEAAQFINPARAAQLVLLESPEFEDAGEAIAALAKADPYMVKATAPSPDMQGGSSKVPSTGDAGRDALAAEAMAAHGRTF